MPEAEEGSVPCKTEGTKSLSLKELFGSLQAALERATLQVRVLDHPVEQMHGSETCELKVDFHPDPTQQRFQPGSTRREPAFEATML